MVVQNAEKNRVKPQQSDSFNLESDGNEDIDDSFHSAIRPIACFVQFLGLMPVCGVNERDSPKKLAFKWMSLRVIATLIYISYGICLTYLYLRSIHLKITAINFGKH
jgi:hypothetical protein